MICSSDGCSVFQPLLWVSTLTNQSANLEALLSPRTINVSMPHGKIQWILVCLVLNATLVESAPSTTLWYHGCMYMKNKIIWWSKNKTHHNAHNSCGASSMMKHESFHLGIFLWSFLFKGLNHSTKLLHVWQLVMIHVTNILVCCASNPINVNKWNFTSLVPKVASVEIVPWSSNETVDCNCVRIWIPIVNGTLIPLISHASWK